MKKVLSIILALMTILSSFAFASSVFASGEVNQPLLGYTRIILNKNDLYAMDNYKKHNKYQKYAYNAWTSLTPVEKENLNNTLSAAKKMKYFNGNKKEYYAVQAYIWHVVRPNQNEDKYLINAVKNEYTKLQTVVNEIKKAKQLSIKKPSTMTSKKKYCYVQSSNDAIFNKYFSFNKFEDNKNYRNCSKNLKYDKITNSKKQLLHRISVKNNSASFVAYAYFKTANIFVNISKNDCINYSGRGCVTIFNTKNYKTKISSRKIKCELTYKK